ncbi:MAG: DMT family transporter [Candidatus Aenigmarchaeota archaeon]|nr:DMT family transporter [Candidatus Aenigmarchaeota archaeon]
MKGTFYLVITGILLGTTGIWAKLVGASVSPFMLTILRTIFSAAMILALIILSKKINTRQNLGIKKSDIPLFLAAGFFGVTIGFGFYIKSFSYIPVANAVALVYVYPIATSILSYVFLKEKITRKDIVANALIICGIVAIYGPEINVASSVLGNLLALVAGIGYSVFIVFMRYFESKGMPYWKVTFWPLLIGGLLLLLFMPFEQFTFTPSGSVPLFIAGIAVSSFLGYIFYAEGLKIVRAHDSVIISTLIEPLSAIAIAFVVLAEAVPENVLIGAALIIAANVLIGFEHRKKRIRRCKDKKPQACFGWTW